jgi:hypothetical protein
MHARVKSELGKGHPHYSYNAGSAGLVEGTWHTACKWGVPVGFCDYVIKQIWKDDPQYKGDARIGFFDPIVSCFRPRVFDPRISCGTRALVWNRRMRGLQLPKLECEHDGSLERPDRGRHFVLSRSRPAARWRELGLLQTSFGGLVACVFLLSRGPCATNPPRTRRGRNPREK